MDCGGMRYASLPTPFPLLKHKHRYCDATRLRYFGVSLTSFAVAGVSSAMELPPLSVKA